MRAGMAHVITDKCSGTCNFECTDVCPNEAIHPTKTEIRNFGSDNKQLFINPDKCCSCGACEALCPNDAIYDEENLPTNLSKCAQINREYFEET